MSRIMKFFDDLADPETEEMRNIFHSLYGPLAELTLIVPTYKRSKLLMTLTLAVIFATMLIGHFVLLVIFCWVEKDNLEHFSMALNYCLIFSLALVLLFIVNNRRSLVFENHWVIARTFSQYRHSTIYEEPEVVEIRKEVQREFYMLMVLPAGSVAFTCVGLWGPYLKHFGEERMTENGANLNLLIPCYYPFPTANGMPHFITVGLQIVAISILASLVLTALLIILRQCQCMQFEYRVACYALESTINRAARVYKAEYPERDPTKINEMDPLFQRCIGLHLRDVAFHHHNILKFGGCLESIVTWIAAWAIIATSGTLGLSLINVLMAKKHSDYENIVTYTLLGCGEVFTIFCLCRIGEAVTTDADTFRDATYFMEWLKLDVSNRRTLLNLQVGALKPFVLTAGKIMPVNHETFGSIMNSAYSFFNIILAGLED